MTTFFSNARTQEAIGRYSNFNIVVGKTIFVQFTQQYLKAVNYVS
jgi:hypothetical protein